MILGMHRSGTSTVAGVLHMNNIAMGTYENFWPRPLSQNPKGFYENFHFRKINDQMLKFSGYDVKSYNPDIPMVEINNKLLSKMKELVDHNNFTILILPLPTFVLIFCYFVTKHNFNGK